MGEVLCKEPFIFLWAVFLGDFSPTSSSSTHVVVTRQAEYCTPTCRIVPRPTKTHSSMSPQSSSHTPLHSGVVPWGTVPILGVPNLTVPKKKTSKEKDAYIRKNALSSRFAFLTFVRFFDLLFLGNLHFSKTAKWDPKRPKFIMNVHKNRKWRYFADLHSRMGLR